MKISHGLLVATNHPTNKKSAVIFNNDIIITTASILYPYFRKYDSLSKNTQKDNVINNLKQYKLVNSENDYLKTLDFEITFDHSKFGAKSKNLMRYKGNIIFVFNCKNISKSTENILELLDEPSGSDSIQTFNRDLNRILMSSFVILQLVVPDKPKTGGIKRFVGLMRNYMKYIDPINKLDDILTISTPFGMESFYKTINIGKISNVFGKDSCLFIISNALVSGCEGAAVISSHLKLIGIIIGTSFRRNNENANLTLAANFRYILEQFLIQTGDQQVNIYNRIKDSSIPPWENSIVLLNNNGSWGTGTLIKLHNKRFILTCAHVVRDTTHTITCYYINGKFETKTIWKNPEHNQPYDIAILTVPIAVPEEYFLKISYNVPRLGQTIYSAGFPLFSHLGKEIFKPSLYEGRIIKCSPGMIISDASVQAGQSGGPLLDTNGSLIGVTVSNSRDQESNVIYPHINMAVPAWNIKDILEKYSKSDDAEVLNNLIAGDDIKHVWALKGPLVTCKL